MPTSKKIDAETLELIHSIGLLVRRVRASTAPHGLSLTESSVLGRLDRNGPTTTADLARAENVRPQSMGSTIAALEQLSLVERSPHPTDGRQSNIALTALGRTTRQSLKDAKHLWLSQAVAQLAPEEQQLLFAAGKLIQRLAEQ